MSCKLKLILPIEFINIHKQAGGRVVTHTKSIHNIELHVLYKRKLFMPHFIVTKYIIGNNVIIKYEQNLFKL